MPKRVLILLALIAVVALPFGLRPKRGAQLRADDTVVIITPHNEAIRFEYGSGFAAWYRARTGRTVSIDWRIVGGTSEIARFLEGEYVAAFENLWTGTMKRAWSAEIQAGFQNGRLPAAAPAFVKEARAAFLNSDVGCGIDVFFGGGTYDFEKQVQAGRLVVSGMLRLHPEWFTDDVIPRRHGGEDYWQRDGLWFGTVLSSYGILFNRDALKRLGFGREPAEWADLADPRLAGEVGLADPTKSGSVAKAFENMFQQQMQRRLGALRAAEPAAGDAELEARAVKEGWREGLKLVQRIGANARYFTDSSQKPPIDVAAGNCAAGLCIDFYGRQQQEAVRRRDRTERLGYISPPGGSVASVDPIALLRGAKNRAAAVAFIEYSLSPEGQKLWNFKPGAPGGPQRFALRRLPVRRDFYQHPEWKPLLSDPDDSPYEQREPLVYRESWTGGIFREMAFVIRVMCHDTHPELVAAWRAINTAPEPAKTRALAVLQELSAVEYERVKDEIRRALGSKDKVDEVRLTRKLGDVFRGNYVRAARIARGED
ncbi:MAG: extracellular solute-binding protein [Verrucomicrobia bacterium]|nr:extracellular solute-binding protein [Verrucomicrobiota bacterium]